MILLVQSPAIFPVLVGVVCTEDCRGEPGRWAEPHCCVGEFLLDGAVLSIRDGC